MLTEFLESLFFFALGIVLDRWASPILLRWLKKIETKRARERYKATRTPKTPKEFMNYRLGNIEVAMMNLLGSPETPFVMDEVKTKYIPLMHHQQPEYPASLIDSKSYLEQVYMQRYGLNRFSRTELPRLSSYQQEGETDDDKRGNLNLVFNLTTFDTYLTTNRSLDYSVIPQSGTISRFIKNRTIREAYVHFPYNPQHSVLSNPLGVIVVVVSRNLRQTPQEQVIIRRRSRQVTSYRGCYQASAAGYMNLAHRDKSGMLSPFVTAVEEAHQEIADGLRLSPTEFKLIGIALSWEDMLPCVYGYIETGVAVEDLFGDFRRDAFEGWLDAIPFDPKTVLSHISHNKWTPESVLAMCATLLVYFPREEVETVARQVPAKAAHVFFENYE